MTDDTTPRPPGDTTSTATPAAPTPEPVIAGAEPAGAPADSATTSPAAATSAPPQTLHPDAEDAATGGEGLATASEAEPAMAPPPETLPAEPAPAQPAPAQPAPPEPPAAEQSSMAAPKAPPTSRGLSYAVDIVFCIDVTGSMTPIIDAVKTNAMRFYDDVQSNLTDKGKNVDELRVRVIAFRDFTADGEAALQESAFFQLPGDQSEFSSFVSGLRAEGGGDAPESGLEAVALAVNSPWTTRGDRRRQVVVVWTDQPAHPLDPTAVPPGLRDRVPADFSALTDLWEDAQGPLGSSSKRLILFAPDGPGWSDISSVWENVVHHPSQAGGGLSDVDYGTIVDSIGNSV